MDKLKTYFPPEIEVVYVKLEAGFAITEVPLGSGFGDFENE